MKLRWDFMIYCPNCGKRITGLDPRYDRSFPSYRLNGWVNVGFDCTGCGSKGTVSHYRPNYVQL